MTTSGTITATMTAREIINKALARLAIIASGETATSDEAQDAMVDLGLMLKSWQTDCNLWREEEVTFVATTVETVLEPRCIDVIEARIETPYERPLARWEWGDYINIPTKTQAGTPSCFTVRKQRDSVSMLLWPAPSIARPANVVCTVARVIEDVTDLEQTIDVPQEWIECVVLNLAVIIAPSYGATPSPLVMQRADTLLTQMRDLDRPASYSMGPFR